MRLTRQYKLIMGVATPVWNLLFQTGTQSRWRNDQALQSADAHSMSRLSDVIAANVRAERARRRWSQQELADRSGLSRSTIADLEIGTRRITADHLPVLCRAFGVTFAEMIRGADAEDVQALRITPQ
jgi:ribosome-binding protein aMBF1 (putative translation factor)